MGTCGKKTAIQSSLKEVFATTRAINQIHLDSIKKVLRAVLLENNARKAVDESASSECLTARLIEQR